jgi:hypothetical protein
LVIGIVSVHRGQRCYNTGCKRCSPFWKTQLEIISNEL